jgi:hypothetical protein
MYILAFLLLFHPIAIGFAFVFPITDSQQKLNKHKRAFKHRFKSNDGGQTWQDISEVLSCKLQ